MAADETADGIFDLDRWLAIDRARPAPSDGRGWWAFPTPRAPSVLIPTDPRAWPAAAELMSHSRRGGWFACALPWLARLRVPAALASPATESPLESWLAAIAGPRRWNFAIYYGTPSVFTKHTVQCQDESGLVLAYAKIPAGIRAADSIRNEALALQRLESALPGELFFPRLLGQEHAASLQSAPPPGTSAAQASARSAARTAGILSAALHCDLPWRDSPVRAIILETSALCQAAGHPAYASTLSRAAERLDAEFSGIPCLRHRFSHGDFLAWNTRECGGTAFAFDWEWAAWRLPFHDAYHFVLMPTLGSSTIRNHRGPHVLANLPGGSAFRKTLEFATGECADEPLWLISFLAERLAFYVKHCLAAGLNPPALASVRDLLHLLTKACQEQGASRSSLHSAPDHSPPKTRPASNE